jgi:hypothetical protein
MLATPHDLPGLILSGCFLNFLAALGYLTSRSPEAQEFLARYKTHPGPFLLGVPPMGQRMIHLSLHWKKYLALSVACFVVGIVSFMI